MNYVQKTINKVISLNYMLNGMNYYIIYAFFCFGVTKNLQGGAVYQFAVSWFKIPMNDRHMVISS